MKRNVDKGFRVLHIICVKNVTYFAMATGLTPYI